MHALPARSYPGITQRAPDPLPPPSGERAPLTELSNVVAYVCRRSHDEDRHHVQFSYLRPTCPASASVYRKTCPAFALIKMVLCAACPAAAPTCVPAFGYGPYGNARLATSCPQTSAIRATPVAHLKWPQGVIATRRGRNVTQGVWPRP
jgi:hypothetical protein